MGLDYKDTVGDLVDGQLRFALKTIPTHVLYTISEASRQAGDGIIETTKREDLCYSTGTFTATLCSGASVYMALEDVYKGDHINGVAVTHPPCKYRWQWW